MSRVIITAGTFVAIWAAAYASVFGMAALTGVGLPGAIYAGYGSAITATSAYVNWNLIERVRRWWRGN